MFSAFVRLVWTARLTLSLCICVLVCTRTPALFCLHKYHYFLLADKWKTRSIVQKKKRTHQTFRWQESFGIYFFCLTWAMSYYLHCVCSAVLQYLCRRLPEASGGLSGRRRTQQQLLWREGETRRVKELRLGALPSVELQRLGRGEMLSHTAT